MNQEVVLITGAGGQLGTVLTKELQQIYGITNVVATDIRPHDNFYGTFEILDATDLKALEDLVKKYNITQIYHLAAILSAKGEQAPMPTWDINMKTFFNVLEVARLNHVDKVFYPSSIAVFGNNIERVKTPQSSYLVPETVYGISKAAGEQWANYYFKKYKLDVRSLRYPGIVGYQSLGGGGTTDYAVDIFHSAIKQETFECFLEPTTTLPMMYMDDAIQATIALMQAPKENLKTRTSYNIAGISFSPEELAGAIQKTYPNFKITYKPDFRQSIANSWPMSIDDSEAQRDWNWQPKYNLELLTESMLNNLKLKYSDNTITL